MKIASRHLLSLLTSFALANTFAFAEEPPATPDASEQPPLAAPLAKKKFNRSPGENVIGYTQAIRVGNTLYVSGVTGGGEMPDAIQKSYSTIAKVLAAHGLSFQHVVKETIYTTDIEALKAQKDVRKGFYGTDFPAATWVQVARLFRPEHVIEVDVTAVFPDPVH